MRVLIVEDHAKMAVLLRSGFEKHGLVADVTLRGEDALWLAGTTRFDVLILDVMLPGIDGFETCRRMRADGVNAPILMLTARDGIGDRVAGLTEGADDYLVKPFSFVEVQQRRLARSRATPEGEPLAGVHRQIDLVEGGHARLALPIGHGDALAGDQRRRSLDRASRAHAATLPSRISITRSARAATRSECVTTTTVLPKSRQSFSRASSTTSSLC
jgi:DNA-binding response OmpR family regulator